MTTAWMLVFLLTYSAYHAGAFYRWRYKQLPAIKAVDMAFWGSWAILFSLRMVQTFFGFFDPSGIHRSVIFGLCSVDCVAYIGIRLVQWAKERKARHRA